MTRSKALFLTAAIAFASACRAHAAEPTATGPTVYMIGDSTMADYAVVPAQALRGWGQMLHMYFKDGARVDNHAMSGRSCRSFIAEGRWQVVKDHLKEGDYVIIQFGHNDEKKEDPKRYADPFGDYKNFLAGFIKDIRGKGAHPILVTPVSRRVFGADNKIVHTHGDYAVAVRKLAEEEKVPLLDLEARTAEELEKMGPEHSKIWFMWVPANEFPGQTQEKQDNTHFNGYGADRICDLAIVEIKKNAPDLAKWEREGYVDPKKR
jgi:lysophospholipase L1-like esterase